MTSLCPFSLYKPHSLMMSHTMTSVSCSKSKHNDLCGVVDSNGRYNYKPVLCGDVKVTHLRACNKPCSQCVVMYNGDSRLVAIK